MKLCIYDIFSCDPFTIHIVCKINPSILLKYRVYVQVNWTVDKSF